MNVRIHFFGMIAEATSRKTLIIDNYLGTSIKDVKKDLFLQFPELSSYSFQVALNKVIVDENEMLLADNEIAILPPFAGG